MFHGVKLLQINFVYVAHTCISYLDTQNFQNINKVSLICV